MKYHPKSIPFIIKSQSVDEVPPTVNTRTLPTPLQPPTPPSSSTHTDYNHTLTFPYTHPTNNPNLPLSTPTPPPPAPPSNTQITITLSPARTHPLQNNLLQQQSPDLLDEGQVSVLPQQGPPLPDQLAVRKLEQSHLHTTTLPSTPGSPATHLYPPAHNHTAVNTWLTCNTPVPTCTQPHCRQHLNDLQHTCTHLHTTTLPSAPG